MDGFQRTEARGRILERSIIPRWAEFRCALESLVSSYNGTSPGRVHPATFQDAANRTVISSEQGFAPDGFRSVSIIVRVMLDKGRYSIEATKEVWHLDPPMAMTPVSVTIPEPVSTKRYLYHLDCDVETGDTWLTGGTAERATPSECAEQMLMDALGWNS